MPKRSHMGHYPRNHKVHSTSEERGERVLHQADDENRAFYENNAEIAANVSQIMTGVREDIATTLQVNGGLVDRIRTERVKSEIYRNVQGEYMYETENGEDSKNYLASENVKYLSLSKPRKVGRQFMRVLHGAASMVGFNNIVESAVEARFGASGNAAIQRNWVNRLRPFVTNLNLNAGNMQTVAQIMGVPANIAAMNKWLNASNVRELRNLWTRCDQAGIHLPNEETSLNIQRRFVAERFVPILGNMNALNLSTVANLMGTAINIPDMVDWLEGATLAELRDLKQNSLQAGINLTNEEAFDDLMLLTDVTNRETSKIGMANIYDETRLRAFHDGMLATGLNLAQGQPVPPEAQMMRKIQDILIENSLFPLKDNPDGMALLAEIQSRVSRNGAQEVHDEIVDITENELPNTEISDAQRQQIVTCRTEVTPLIREVHGLPGKIAGAFGTINAQNLAIQAAEADVQQHRTQLTGLQNQKLIGLTNDLRNANSSVRAIATTIASAQASLSTAPANQQQNIQKTIDSLNKSRNEHLKEIRTINTEISDIKINGITSRRMTELEARVTAARASRSSAETLLQESENSLRTKMNEIFESMRRNGLERYAGDVFGILSNTQISAANAAAFCQILTARIANLDTQVIRRLEQIVTARERVTPYILLQRLLRRDYLNAQNPPQQANIFSEEADVHANIKATLRVKDAENVDIFRSANDNASEYINKGMLARGGNKLKMAVAKGQSFIGLEPFNIRTLSADNFLEQLINSNADFQVFKGVNKFTTPRDLTQIISSTGKEVPHEVLERFTQIMEESISQFKEVPQGLNGKLDAGDWDLENLIIVFQKFKMQRWNAVFMKKLDAIGGTDNRENAYLKLMRESRDEERRISAEIRKDVRNPDAMWRKLLFKDELKKVLDKDVLEGNNKIKEAGIADRERTISKLREKASASDVSEADKLRLNAEIANHQQYINTLNRQINDAKDLYERVEIAKKYILENKLSRADKREYLAQTGLTQVFDKMGTNYRLKRSWESTKKGAKWTSGKAYEGWSWSRRKFLNVETAKSFGKKSFSVLRLAATPITTPLGWAWKAGTFPVRLVGRALLGTARVPGRLWRMMSVKAKRNWLRNRKLVISEKFENVVEKQARLQIRITKAPYSWDRKRILRRINELEESKVGLNEELSGLVKIANESKIPFDIIGFTSFASNDNSAKPAEAPKDTKKAA